jgi:hypothetical protein
LASLDKTREGVTTFNCGVEHGCNITRWREESLERAGLQELRRRHTRELRVDDEDGHDIAVTSSCRLQKSAMVTEAQVATQPEDDGR